MSDEDKLAKYFVGRQREETEEHYEMRGELEVPYNDYGTRGVVDYVEEINPNQRRGSGAIRIVEFKSGSAVRNATGANEIIRQFKRHQSAFFEGNDTYPKYGYAAIWFTLAFYPDETTIGHVKENIELYDNILYRPFEDSGKQVFVCFIDPETGVWYQIHARDKYYDFWDNLKEETL